MPVDAVLIHGLQAELSTVLTGAKIDKIQQPERDMLLLSLRTQSCGSKKLLLCGGVGNARAHFTVSAYENPAEAPMFCMLMRKHLTGGRIKSVEQPGFERMLVFRIEARDEMGDTNERLIVLEMMGRSSNIILVDSEGRITDCVRRMDFGGDVERRLLPGMLYRFPPKQNKLPLFESDTSEFADTIKNFSPECDLYKQLMDKFSGLSPLVAREIAQAGFDTEKCISTVQNIRSRIDGNLYVPYMLSDNAVPVEFSFMPIRQYGSAYTGEEFPSFSELLDAFYTGRDKAAMQRKRSKELLHSVRTARDRIQRKLINQREELKRTDGREEIRKNAELLTANLYKLKKGDRIARVQDYYSPDYRETEILLDPLKTPQQNAAALFKEYNKLKTAREYLTVLVEQAENQVDYLTGVLSEIELTESERDLAEIRAELTESGFLRLAKQKSNRKVKPQQPYRFISPAGLEILAGRSNLQNDELSKNSRRSDFWFHVQKLHGSHVILKTDGLEPDEGSIAAAAEIAAWFSEARGNGKTVVDYTQVRWVKKPSGSLPGKVIYTNYQSIVVVPDETCTEKYK